MGVIKELLKMAATIAVALGAMWVMVFGVTFVIMSVIRTITYLFGG